jgi:hypothetical protein
MGGSPWSQETNRPPVARLDLHALHLINPSPGVEGPVHLLVAKRVPLMNNDSPRKATGMPSLVNGDAAGHHRSHVRSGQKRIVEVNALTHVVRHELQSMWLTL